jgi:hypothetical protein
MEWDIEMKSERDREPFQVFFAPEAARPEGRGPEGVETRDYLLETVA